MNVFDELKHYSDKRSEPTSVLELDGPAAFEFFMGNDQYCTTELPSYFDFTAVLKYAAETIGNKSLDECANGIVSPESISDVNLEVLTNKDGRYAVRPLSLTNPFLHYMLVREICNENAWKRITDCFQSFAHPCVKACSIPMVKPKDKNEPFKNATTILNWWNSMEQGGIELSLKYRYMFMTDITNCFGQINLESISWALGLKDTPMATSENDALAQNIQIYLRAMRQGKNMGIPQGNKLFAFIAEIVLGYSDMLLAQEITNQQKAGILPENLEYQVLRYVDDYRIFCNDREALEKISYILQSILERFNFRMNSAKTRTSSELIADSIKPDKAYYIFNTPIESKQTYRDLEGKERRVPGYDFDSLQKHLLFIYEFSRRFPNAGQLVTLLEAFSRRIDNLLDSKPQHNKWATVDLDGDIANEKASEKTNPFKNDNIPAIVAIAVEIALRNLRAVPYALRVASQLLKEMQDDQRRQEIIHIIYLKLKDIANSDFIQVWIQNITHTTDDWSNGEIYRMPLCKLVANQPTTLWNNSWLKSSIADALPISSIINRDQLAKSGPVIIFNPKPQYSETICTF